MVEVVSSLLRRNVLLITNRLRHLSVMALSVLAGNVPAVWNIPGLKGIKEIHT